jgi:hypothetical protein
MRVLDLISGISALALIPKERPLGRVSKDESHRRFNASVSRHNSSACRNRVAIPHNFQKFFR